MATGKREASAAKAGIGYAIGNILIKGLSFLTLPIFTRLMSTSDYGLYSTYVSYESILALVVGLGLYVSLKAAKIEFKEKLDEYVSLTLFLPLLFSMLMIIVLLPFTEQVGDWFGFGGNKWIIVLMICQAWSSTIITLYNCRVSLDFSYKNYVMLSVVSTISNIGLSLLLMITLNRENPFWGRVLGTCIPSIGIGIFLIFYFLRKAKPVYNREYLKFGLTYSLPLVPHGLSQQVLSQFGKIVIQRKIGNDAAGIYGFVYTIALIPQILVASLDNAWGPWFFQKYEKQEIGEIKIRTNQYVALFSSGIVALFAVAPEVVKVMGGESYWSAINIVIPAILGVYFTFLYTIPAQVEYYHKKTKFIAIGTMIAALFDIAACLLFIPRYGYECAVFITIGTYALYFIAHIVIALKITGNKVPFSLRSILIYAVSVCIMCVMMQVCIEKHVARYICAFLYLGTNIWLHRKVLRSYIRKQ